jgi:4-hydroxy-tetrahydrodipicolinate reductase
MDSISPLEVALSGATGRMGRALLEVSAAVPGLRIVAGLSRDPAHAAYPDGIAALPMSAVAEMPPQVALVDFSRAEGFDGLLDQLERRPRVVLSGTTGLSAVQQARFAALGGHSPVLWGANFSRGVAVLADLVERAARALPGWQADLVESHHRHKQDAPSGTALRLREAAQQGGATVGTVASLRCGDVVGEHLVQFSSDGERIELTHRATDRRIFARGALQCVVWLASQPAGVHTVRDWAIGRDGLG